MENLKLIDIIYVLSDKCSEHREKHLRELRLLKAEYKGLTCMDKHREITCKEFSEKMGLSLSRGSRIIDKLYKRNYILRADSDSDRRCKMIRLTESGKEARNRIEKEKNKCERKLVSAIPGNKLDQLKKGLTDLIGAL
ncbi:MAG: MarR family transcriptional regulator [Candidatus Aminicenantes bacterium]|nr:MarR family transcriptional regulator [Candidatus Aminicenantes bacterium]